ncbi:hypothetical protein AJ80_03340 [Polytolypa hystricis UAMH7299]|uniref:Enoyl reductase (ER) domain-containing protein n=1 Tax=Polytolypa hystricis (strain UAMH7299) TaxID=1447883 RepID=A0A2B7YJD4_POLH7|nr:hypothetical protein AJ80_03340 [Polytolypa hystricis UAMH7299]
MSSDLLPTESIPKTHKALIYSEPGTTATKIIDVETPTPQAGEVLIRLKYSGVCHTDLSLVTGAMRNMPPTQTGQIGGHEGVGVVVACGPGVTARQIGDHVGVKWITSACLVCELCLQGDESRCPERKISGFRGSQGTFQQYLVSDARYVTPIARGIVEANRLPNAAPLLCGGVTVFAALKKADVKPGDWVALSGGGGGLGSLAIEYAKAMGFLVLAIDHGSKRDFCLGLGADAFIDFTAFGDNAALTQEVKSLTDGGAHAILVNNSSMTAYDQAIDLLRYGGTLVCVGLPEGETSPLRQANPGYLIPNKLTIRGTMVGSRKDAIEALKLLIRGQVNPQVEVRPMNKLTEV